MLVHLILVPTVMLSALLIDCFPTEYEELSLQCSTVCSAGSFLRQLPGKCECVPCRVDFFTNQDNKENSCRRCFQGCSADVNMEVEENCTTTSDVKCRCLKGFVCRKIDPITSHCSLCSPIPASTSTDVPSVRTQTTIQSSLINNPPGGLVRVLVGAISMLLISIFLAIVLRFCRKKKECFKKIVRTCSQSKIEVNRDISTLPNQPIEHLNGKEILSQQMATHHNAGHDQPMSFLQPEPPKGSLGPLHIYGTQTVFVSLLNQFGWNGEEKQSNIQQDELLNNSSLASPQSPSTHLSEEERGSENEFISFPSQEQGEVCGLSKEDECLG